MKRLKSFLAVFLCFCMLIGIFPDRSVKAATNILIPEMGQSIPVVNAGFEEPVVGGAVPGWPSITANTTGIMSAVDSSFAYTGNNSFYIKDISDTKGFTAVSDKIKVEAGETYNFTAKVYILSGSLKIYVQFCDIAGKQTNTSTYSVTANYSTNPQWTNLSIEKAAPANTDYVLIKLVTDKSASGEGYFDDVTLIHKISLSSGKVMNNGLDMSAASDGTIPGWNVTSGSQSDVALSNITASGSGNSLSITNSVYATTEIESYPIGVAFDETYTVSGSVYSNDTNSAGINLRFYDNTGNLISSSPVKVAGSGIGKWVTLTAKNNAPAGAAYATVGLSKSSLVSAAAYFDDFTFKSGATIGTFTNLGTQILSATVPSGAITKDASGNIIVAAPVNGTPVGQLAIVNVTTSELISEIDLGGTEQSWVMMTDEEDGSIYIGGVKNGHLYKYVPGNNQVEDLGQAVVGQTHLYGLAKSTRGIIYGASYGGNNNFGKIFSYDPTTSEFTDLGVVAEGETYARALAYAPDENALYIGTGTKCKLIRYDIAHGTKSSNLLPDSYSIEEYPNNIDIIGNKLFIALNKTGSIIVIDKTTGEIEYTIQRATKRVVKSPDETKAYVFSENNFSYYDIASKTLVPIVDLGANYSARTLKVVELNTAEFPGQTLIAWLGNDTVFKYNFETGKIAKDLVELTGQPTEIRSIYAGPDGNIYSGGMLGGLTAYDPISNKTVYLGKTSQPEGITHYKDSLYLGLYPGARVLKYDTTVPFNNKNGNPVEIFKTPQQYYQDRPFGMTVAEDIEKMYVGTVAQYGYMQGSLSTYDFKTGEWQTVTDIVYNQSIVSLAYKDGKIYGGTAIWGSLGADASQREKEAKFFVLDTATGKIEHEISPIENVTRSIITGLIEGPDGNIWGVAEGYLFIYDPNRMAVVYSAQISPYNYSTESWKDANLSVGTDGNVYGTANGIFFKVSTLSKKITILDKANGYNNLVQDAFGNFYFRSSTKSDLIKYTDESLIVKLIAAQLSASNTSIGLGQTGKLSITGILEKGRTTKGFEHGNVQYTFSNPGIISVNDNGVILTLAKGETSVIATVTVEGVTFTTNEINIKVLDNNAFLSDLKVNGVTVIGFTYDKNDYNVILPYSVASVPAVSAATVSKEANVNIINASTIPGPTSVVVTAEDGITKNIYSVFFDVENSPVITPVPVPVPTPTPTSDDNGVKDALKDYKDAKPEDKAKILEKALDTIDKALDKASTIEEKFISKEESDTGVNVTVEKGAIENIIAKLTETKQSIEASLKDASIDSAANLDRKEIVIEVKELIKQEMKIALPAESIKALEIQGIGLLIETNGITFKVPATALSLNDSAEKVELTTKKVSEAEIIKGKNLIQAGEVLDFNMTVYDGTTTKKVENFKEKVIVKLAYNGTDINEDKLGVYRFNPETNTWDYVGGKVNKDDNTVEFATPHFSIYTVMEYNKTFADITNHWAKNDIELMAAKHIQIGKDEVNFAPEDKLTRAEFAATIVRALGLDTVNYSNGFSDVSDDEWYADVIQTAANKGLIKGDGKSFRPEDTITREEMTALMVRAYKLAAGKTPESGDISKFKDKDKISSWAQEDVEAAYGMGLIKGAEEEIFAPEANATRAESAVIIKRLLSKI